MKQTKTSKLGLESVEISEKMKLSIFLPFFVDGRAYRPKNCVNRASALPEMRKAAMEMGWNIVKRRVFGDNFEYQSQQP